MDERSLDGVLVVDKPWGITSFSVVEYVRELLRVKKVGHTGTLDPGATGVLVLCVGKATKMVPLFMEGKKEYITEMRLGVATDTQDMDGEVTGTFPVEITKEGIEEVLSNFSGEIEQIPPMASALHHKGRRLYELARQGIEVERAPRKVHIHSLELLHLTEGRFPELTIRVVCSKGTYVRTLCADIGKALGCGAYMSSLRRIRNGNFTLDEALNLEELRGKVAEGKVHDVLISPDEVLKR